MPAVLLILKRAVRKPYRIVAGLVAGMPDDVTITVECQAWAFSAQGPADAGRQRDELMNHVVDAIRADPTIGGLVNTGWCQAGQIDFHWAPGTSEGSIFAVGVLALSILVMA